MRVLPLVLLLLLPLLPVASAAPVADDGCAHAADLVHACTSENGNGDPCAEVWLSRQPPVVDACVPLSALVNEVCVVRVCVYQGDDGLCVGGQIAHPPFEHCLGSVQLAASSTDAACAHADPSVHVCVRQGPCVDLVVEREPVLDDACVPPRASEASAETEYPCVYYSASTWVCKSTRYDGATCVGGAISYRPWSYCVGPRQTDAAAGDACEEGQTGVCSYQDAYGHTCWRVQLGWHAVADECFVTAASTDAPEYPCVFYNASTFVCYENGPNGEMCVVGAIGGRRFGECFLISGDATAASYPCVYATEDVWVCYDRGCVEGMYGHYPIGYCLPPVTVEAAEPCLPGELACVEREGRSVCVTYRTGDLEDPRRACFG